MHDSSVLRTTFQINGESSESEREKGEGREREREKEVERGREGGRVRRQWQKKKSRAFK